MASLYNKGGYLYISYYERVKGKSRKKQFALRLTDNTENRKKGEIVKKQIELELLKEKPIKSYYFLLSEAFEQFMETKKHSSDSTKILYRTAFRSFIETNGDLFGSDVDEKHVLRFKDALEGKSQTTIAIYFRHMQAFFNWMLDKSYVAKVYFKREEIQERGIRPLSNDQFDNILKHCSNEEQRFILTFMIRTGFRVSEAVNLEWEDIDFERNIIFVKNTKGKRVDEFPISDKLRDFLLPKKSTGKVFSYKDRHSLRFFKRIVKNLGYNDVMLHDLRKTFCCRLVNDANPVSIYDASKLMRHKSIRETEKFYAQVNQERLRGEADKAWG